MKNLSKLRKQNGISQAKLGKDIGLARNTICQYESGNRSPDISTLIKIADYFNVSMDYLWGRDEKKYLPVKRPEYALSETFAKEYADLLTDKSFINTTKIFHSITIEQRNMLYGYILGLMDKMQIKLTIDN